MYGTVDFCRDFVFGPIVEVVQNYEFYDSLNGFWLIQGYTNNKGLIKKINEMF